MMHPALALRFAVLAATGFVAGAAIAWALRPAFAPVPRQAVPPASAPASTPDLVDQAGSSEAKLRALEQTVAGISHDHDFPATCRLLLLPDEEKPSGALTAQLIIWAGREGEVALEWMLAETPSEWRTELFLNMSPAWIWEDPQGFFDWYKGRRLELRAHDVVLHDILKPIVEAMIKRDSLLGALCHGHCGDIGDARPAEIKRQIRNSPDPPGLLEKLRALPDSVLPNDRYLFDDLMADLAHFVNTPDETIEPSQIADNVLANVAPANRPDAIIGRIPTFRRDLPSASAWAESLADPAERTIARGALVYHQSESDLPATITYIESLDVPPDEKQALLEIAATAPPEPDAPYP
ncbi:hypothetical protein BH23VER1_BH23VER1_13680 [soil metagenome]